MITWLKDQMFKRGNFRVYASDLKGMLEANHIREATKMVCIDRKLAEEYVKVNEHCTQYTRSGLEMVRELIKALNAKGEIDGNN